MATVGAVEAGEPGGEIAAAVELIDHGDGVSAQRAVDFAVDSFVSGEKIVPGMADDLP